MQFSIEETDGKKKYIVDGVEYERLEDVPEEYQKLLKDSNKDGVPDRFEGLMGKDANPISAMKALFNIASGDVKGIVTGSSDESSDEEDSEEVAVTRKRESGTLGNTSSSSPLRDTPIYNRTERRDGESSSSSFFIKMFVVAFIGVAAAWVYINYIKPKMNQPAETVQNPAENSEEPASSSLEVVATESETATEGGEEEGDAAPVDDLPGITITLEDPNVQPYHVFSGVYENGVRILTLDVPEYELGSSDRTFLRFVKNEKEKTNLSEASIQYFVAPVPCEYPEEMQFSKATIGDVEFDLGVNEGYESRKSYITRHYSLDRNGQCITFMLSMEITNAGFLGPDVKTFDVEAEVKMFESLLATLKFDER